jgi:regulator of ribonuclease activity A
MPIALADLCDQHIDQLQVATPLLTNYGAPGPFEGEIVTVKVYEDNVLVRQALEERNQGKILVIDGGGSLACALLGDMLAKIACQSGWAGIIINGCIRDSKEIARLPLGVRALNTNPRKSRKTGEGQSNIPVTFAGITFTPGHYLYADEDGIVVAPRKLA